MLFSMTNDDNTWVEIQQRQWSNDDSDFRYVQQHPSVPKISNGAKGKGEIAHLTLHYITLHYTTLYTTSNILNQCSINIHHIYRCPSFKHRHRNTKRQLMKREEKRRPETCWWWVVLADEE
jgi:hypothetical protein